MNIVDFVLLLAVLALCFLAWFGFVRRWTIGKVIKRKEDKKEYPKLNSRPFVFNELNGVIAICTSEDFEKGLVEHAKRLEDGEIKLYYKVVIYAKPTFVFYKKLDVQRPVHCGDETAMRLIVRKAVEKMIGSELGCESFKEKYRNSVRIYKLFEQLFERQLITQEELSNTGYDWYFFKSEKWIYERGQSCLTFLIFARKDSRLFVPYAGYANVEQQFEIYGQKTLEEASEYLIGSVPEFKES